MMASNGSINSDTLYQVWLNREPYYKKLQSFASLLNAQFIAIEVWLISIQQFIVTRFDTWQVII